MPVSRVGTSRITDAMKPEDGNDYLDTFIRQAIGKEPLLTFSRTGDNPVHWIQLLHALDQPADLSGWPFLTPLKVQMLKCDKCPREFCSSINYRRHIRVHRRSWKVDKESHQNRNLLAAFWDKLTLDKAMKILSFEDVSLEDVSGSSVIRALTSFARKPGYCALPQVYVKAGSELLDIIQDTPSSRTVSSKELFSVLDEASEGTFLCAGTADSLQKFIFDGDASKIGLEMKNLAACTSFLLEQKLVKVWLADQDAEALRCHKLLVEEEEAARRRHTALLERRRQRKLRQKAKEPTNGEKTSLQEVIVDASESPPLKQIYSSPTASEPDFCTMISSTYDVSRVLESFQLANDEVESAEVQIGFSGEHCDSNEDNSVECQGSHEINHGRRIIARWQVQKPQSGGRYGFRSRGQLHAKKIEPVQKHGPIKDQWVSSVTNGGRVWTRKPKGQNVEDHLENSRLKESTDNAADQTNCEVVIGSISVPMKNCTAQQPDNPGCETQDHSSTEQSLHDIEEELMKPFLDQCDNSKLAMKIWRPVSRHGTEDWLPIQNGNQESEGDENRGSDEKRHNEPCLESGSADCNDSVYVSNPYLHLEDDMQLEGAPFSSLSARAFLAERWKKAILADHVKLILSPVLEPPGNSDLQSESHGVATMYQEQNSIVTVEKCPVNVEGHNVNKSRLKPEKGVKVKYVPKQKTVVA